MQSLLSTHLYETKRFGIKLMSDTKQMSLFGGGPKEKKASAHWKLFVDGASRNNPGPAGVGIYLTKEGEPVVHRGFFVGIKTNNQAEYLALLLGLFFVKQQADAQDLIQILSDSQLLVRQLEGKYRVKSEHLQPMHRAALAIMRELNYDIAHILREGNTHADKMANVGIDKKNPLPNDFVSFLEEHNISC